MKKGFVRKVTACFMAVVMVFSLAGCGKEKGKGKQQEKKDVKDMVYAAELIETDGIEGDISTFFVKDDRIYVNTFVWSEAETEEEEATIDDRYYSVKVDGSDLKEIKVADLEKNETISSWIVNDDGSVLFLLTKYDADTENVISSILKTDAEGNEFFKTDVTETLKLKEREYGVRQMTTDEKGRIIIILASDVSAEVCIFDENAKYVDTLKCENNIEAIAKTKEGKIISCYSGEDGSFAQEINSESQKWGKKYKIDVPCFRGSQSLMNGMTYDFYYESDSGIFGYDLAEENATQVMDFMASNLTSTMFGGASSVTEERFVGTRSDESGTKLYLYSKVDPSEVKEKQTITFGGTYIDDELKKAALHFNQTNQDYQIELIDYGDSEDPETKMNAEIAAGNIPDIMSLSLDDMRENYAAKGMLEDLIPYIEQDEELSTDDFLPTILETLKTGDKLYSLAPCFSIVTIIGKTEDVGEDIGWTFEDMKAVLEKNGNAKPFESDSPMYLLGRFNNTFNDFIDWETGKCTFDSQYFKDILEFCKSGKDVDFIDEDLDERAYQKGDVLFQEVFVKKERIGLYKQQYNADITYIGYPNKDKSGSYFNFYSEVGISSKSDVKEGAWEFVRTLMTKEYQAKRTASELEDCLPVRKDSYAMFEKAMMTTEQYTDEFGHTVSPLDSGMVLDDDFILEIKPLSQEEMDQFNELVAHTHKRSFSDRHISEIIEEEVQPYFAGDKDVDATAEIIQNRVTTYINESR